MFTLLKGLQKTFRGTARQCENKNLSFYFNATFFNALGGNG